MSDASIDIDVDLAISRAVAALEDLQGAAEQRGRQIADDLDVEPRIDSAAAEQDLRELGDTADREAGDVAESFRDVDEAIDETGRRSQGLGTTVVSTWGEIAGAIENVLGLLGDVQGRLDEIDQRSLGTAAVSAQLGLSTAQAAALQDYLATIDRDVTDAFGLFGSVQDVVAEGGAQAARDFAAIGFSPGAFEQLSPLGRLDYLGRVAGGVGTGSAERAALNRVFGESDAAFALELAALAGRTGVTSRSLAGTYEAYGFGATEAELADAAGDQLQRVVGERITDVIDSRSALQGGVGAALRGLPVVGGAFGDAVGLVDRRSAGDVVELARQTADSWAQANAALIEAAETNERSSRQASAMAAAAAEAAAEADERIRVQLSRLSALARSRTAALLASGGASELAPTERGTIAGETQVRYGDTPL